MAMRYYGALSLHVIALYFTFHHIPKSTLSTNPTLGKLLSRSYSTSTGVPIRLILTGYPSMGILLLQGRRLQIGAFSRVEQIVLLRQNCIVCPTSHWHMRWPTQKSGDSA